MKKMTKTILAMLAFALFGAMGELAAQPTFTLAITPTGAGTATFDGDPWSVGTALSSSSIAIDIEAIPAAGYEFVSWSSSPDGIVDDPESASTELDGFDWNTAYTVTATFKSTSETEKVYNIQYVDGNGEFQVCPSAILVTTNVLVWGTEWYVVTNNVTVSGTNVVVNGEANLILCDGAKLEIKNTPARNAGVQVAAETVSLNVFGQAVGDGKLIAKGGNNGAGIGGGGNMGSRDGYNITINSGTVEATGVMGAAGIGGGNGGNGSYITINGGTVTATGSKSGAKSGAGIGGGADSKAKDIRFNYGNVYAVGGATASAIGHGSGVDRSESADIYGSQYAIFSVSTDDDLYSPITQKDEDMTFDICEYRYVKVESYGRMVSIEAAPIPVENAQAEVYTNGFLSTEYESGKWHAWAGQPATVVYTADDGYWFDGVTVVTNELDTVHNPAQNKVSPPEATLRPVSVTYIDAAGDEQTTNAIVVAGSTDTRAAWSAGWYVVTNEITLSKGADCSGAVHLILADGASLTINEVDMEKAGIGVTGDDNSLAIYGQAAGTGTLTANGYDGAGIGGGRLQPGSNITINGGEVTANGDGACAGIGGGDGYDGSDITINGGKVTANGGSEATGIGGGKRGEGKNIMINGGEVNATGSNGAAGIGGGGEGKSITINGGVVVAKGGNGGAGIGGGYLSDGSDITINGGDVTATGGNEGAGIGGGKEKRGSNIRINGGKVTANGGENAFGIGDGNGAEESGSGIYAADDVIVRAGDLADPETVIQHTGTTDLAGIVGFKKRYVTAMLPVAIVAEPIAVANADAEVYTNGVLSAEFESGKWHAWSYLPATVVYTAKPGYVFAGGVTVVTNDLDTTADPAVNAGGAAPVVIELVKYTYPIYVDGVASNGIERWETNRVSTYTVVTSQTSAATWGAAGATNWFVVKGADVKIDGGVVCNGYVNLILCQGAKLTAGGVVTDSDGSFAIYGQPDGDGELEATGGNWRAGIGGGSGYEGKNITINGGKVTAKGGSEASGIGGGSGAKGKNITINGGKVTSTGGSNGAGIGGGMSGGGSDITINGGTIIVIGGAYGGACVGGGDNEAGSNITINDGNIMAVNGNNSDVIGNGRNCLSVSSGNVVSSSANIFFSLVGTALPLPEKFDGFVIMTPETQAVDRVLVGGLSGLPGGQSLPFALTNAVTGATGMIEVDGEKVLFAERLLELPIAGGKLTLKAYEYSTINPPTEVENTTVKVYTNDAELAVGTGIVVTNGTPAYVVYTVADGFIFEDDTTAKTNQLNTTVNPAEILGGVPAAPVPLVVAEVECNGVKTEFRTLEAAWKAAQQGTPENPAVIRLMKDIKLTNTLETVKGP